MKRLSKIFTLLLMAALVLSVVAISASAISSSDELEQHYKNQLKPNGATNYFAYDNAYTGWGVASSIGTNGIAEKVTTPTNTYTSFHYKHGSDTFPSTIGGYYTIKTGSTSYVLNDYGLAFNGVIQQSALTYDMDIMPDRYRVVTENDGTATYKTYTPEELAAAGLTPESDGVELSYYNKDFFYLSLRYTKVDLASNTTSVASSDLKSASIRVYYVKDADGNWYYANTDKLDTATYKVKVSGVGIYDHVTAIAYPKLVTSGENTYAELYVVVYINGEIVVNTCAIESGLKARSVWMDEFRMDVIVDAKYALDSYSYAVDNYTLNYYGAGYTAEGNSISTLISGGKFKNGSILECNDVVGNKNYITPNGYAQVKNPNEKRDFVSIPYAVKQELSKLENGGTIYTTMDIHDFDIPVGVESVFVECDNSKVKIYPSESLSERGYKVKKATGGYTVEMSDDFAILEIYDAFGKLISEKTIGFGMTPNLEGIDPSAVADGVIKYTDAPEWQWSLGGAIGKVDENNAKSGDVIKVTPKDSCFTTISGATFAMGNYDENYRFIPAPANDGTYTLYQNATGDQLITEVIKSTNGNVCILLADFTGLSGDAKNVGPTSIQNLAAGKSFFIDLNGHKLVKFGHNNVDQTPLFTLLEGTELSIYSSRPGGEFLTGSVKTDNGKQLNEIRSGGVAYFKDGIETATLNVGALVDDNGRTVFSGDNFSFTGGMITIVSGGSSTEDLSGGAKKYINIIGGKYFIPFRGSYSFVTLQGPDAVITIDGIQLYGTYSSTSIVHEYEGRSTHGTEVTIRNSEIYGKYLFYDILHGKYHISNSTIATSGAIVHKIGATSSIVIGTGCKIAGSNVANFFKNTCVSLDDGVTMLLPASSNALYSKITKDFTHAAASLSWTDNVDMTFAEGAVIDGAVDTLAEAALVTSFKLKDSVITDKTTTSLSYNCYCITVSKDYVPEGIGMVEWQRDNGDVVATTFHFEGAKANVPAECASFSQAYEWYVEEASWTAISKVSAGKTVAKPVTTIVPKISGIRQNATLFTNMTYNLYLPVSAEATDVSVSGATLEGIVELEGKQYYLITATPAVDEFAPVEATVSYKAAGKALEYAVSLDIVKYASAVADYYICGSEEAILVYEMLAYKGAVAKFIDGAFTPSAEYASYLEKHASCNCYDPLVKFSESELKVGYEALNDNGVIGVAYVLESSVFGFVIYVDNDAVVDSVSYTDPLGRVITHTVANGNIEKKDGYYVVTGISAAYIDNVMTINAGGESGTYSLAKYIENSTDASTKNVATALYTYARAAEEFKKITTTEHKFTVTFDANGGDPVSPIKVQGGQLVPVPEAPKKLAYKLHEWQLDGKKYDFNTPVTSDITLTAVWERAEDNEVYDKMQSVLLIGQSNMLGVGLLSTVEPIEDDRLFMMSAKNNEWVKMQEPLFIEKNTRAGVSLGVSFGKAFVDTFGCDVGLIPAAQGSTTVEMWGVGGDLYNEAVRLAKIAQETSDIAAILWHQGEGNVNTTDYAAKLRVILDSMLAELGLDPNKIIIVTGELFGTRSDAVHMGQLEQLADYYPNYGIALSDGLTVLDVTTHFDGPSLRVFGYRYFAQFYKLLTGKTYVYDDNPANYWVSQIPATDYTYFPFDDMNTGYACTGYTGSGMLTVNGEKGVGYIYAASKTNKYLSAANFVSDKETIYNSVYFDSQNNSKELEYGGVVAVQATIKLGSDHNHAVSLLDVYTEDPNVVYSSFYIDANGNLYVVDANGAKINVMKLNTTDWVSIKVILDTESNLKDVYVNDQIVLRGVAISNDVDTDGLAIDRTRLIDFSVDSSQTKGHIHFDEYRFLPYFDNLQPAE